jgi:hypothetical protein
MWHQPDAAPAMYRIYNREKSFFDLRLGYLLLLFGPFFARFSNL